MLQATFFWISYWTALQPVHALVYTEGLVGLILGQIPYYTEQNSTQMPVAGMGGFGIDRYIKYSIHAELVPQLYESRKTHKDESSCFRSSLNSLPNLKSRRYIYKLSKLA